MTHSRPADCRHQRARHLACTFLSGQAQKLSSLPSSASPRQIQQLGASEETACWSRPCRQSSRLVSTSSIAGMLGLSVGRMGLRVRGRCARS